MSLKMPLQQLLELNKHYPANGILKQSLGDGFLYHENYLFKKIRNQFLQFGFTFTLTDFCHYAVMPYASLPKILKERKVPYFDNVSVLEEIESQHPKKFTCEELIKVKSNYTLHESSHCIAETCLTTHFKSDFLKSTTLSLDSKKAFRLVMAESFANTVESMANIYNQTSEQRLFYELNSYVTHNKKVNSNLKQCVDLISEKSTFHLMYISYLYSNCLNAEPSAKEFQQILNLVITDSVILKKAQDSQTPRKVFNHAFELSLDFRLKTTGFFCAYSGISTPLEKLFNFDLLQVLKNSSCVKDFLSFTQLY